MNPTLRDRLIMYGAAVLAAILAAVFARIGLPFVPPAPIIVTPPAPTEPAEPPPPPPPKPDPVNALVRLSFPGVGCSATILGPRRADGRWWVLTASHCTTRVGQVGSIRLLDGRTFGVTVQSVDKRSDCAWMVTESNSEVLPFAVLATESPPVGSKVHHAGYGIDKPGNREDGVITAAPDSNGQLRFSMSVSSGDSGGGILMTPDGKVISCVCCTTQRGAQGSVWGASPEAIHRAQPTAMVLDDWVPLDIPVRDIPMPLPP